MTFIRQQLDTVQNHFKHLDDIEKQRQKWIEANPHTEGGWYYRENMEKFDAAIADARTETMQSLQMNLNAVKSAMHHEMKGSELTDDVKLLNGSVKLTPADLDKMLERPENVSPTMQRVIHEYAKNHDMMLQHTYYTDSEITGKAQDFTAYCKNAITMPDYRQILETPGMLAKITPAELKDI